MLWVVTNARMMWQGYRTDDALCARVEDKARHGTPFNSAFALSSIALVVGVLAALLVPRPARRAARGATTGVLVAGDRQ